MHIGDGNRTFFELVLTVARDALDSTAPKSEC
jgi:hypothetical protein